MAHTARPGPGTPVARPDLVLAQDCNKCIGWGSVVTPEGRHELCPACQPHRCRFSHSSTTAAQGRRATTRPAGMTPAQGSGSAWGGCVGRIPQAVEALVQGTYQPGPLAHAPQAAARPPGQVPVGLGEYDFGEHAPLAVRR